MSRRIVLFLYGTPNIVGSVLGLLGLGLFFGGLINRYWFFIVVGLYLAGLLLTPRNKTTELTLQDQLSAEDVQDALENLVGKIRGKVPTDVFAQVERIKAAICTLLPKIGAVNSADHARYTVRQTALEYLPDALQHYLNLPLAFANFHPLKDGKTAKMILLEQLDLLAKTMEQIVEDVHHRDTEQLLIHGRFLEERFRKADLFA